MSATAYITRTTARVMTAQGHDCIVLIDGEATEADVRSCCARIDDQLAQVSGGFGWFEFEGCMVRWKLATRDGQG